MFKSGKTLRTFLLSLLYFPSDFRNHLRDDSWTTRPESYRLLRFLVCQTRGTITGLLSFPFRRRNPFRVGLDPQNRVRVQDIRVKGYACVPNFLDVESIVEINKHLDHLRLSDSNLVRSDYSSSDLLGIEVIRNLVLSTDFTEIASHYLRCRPALTQIAAWESYPELTASFDVLSDAAQAFHFDADWIEFLKFFIYLTDVDEANGPFSYLEGSHLRKRFWSDRRYTDDEVSNFGGLERRIIGEKGMLVVANTRGLHRGTPVVSGRRRILQIEFAVSRFGASSQYPQVADVFGIIGTEAIRFG